MTEIKFTSRDLVASSRSSGPEVFCRKGALRNFAKCRGKPLYLSLILIKLHASACNFIKKETLAQVLYCEFCEISKNTSSYRTPPVAAFALLHKSKEDLRRPKYISSFLTLSESKRLTNLQSCCCKKFLLQCVYYRCNFLRWMLYPMW